MIGGNTLLGKGGQAIKGASGGDHAKAVIHVEKKERSGKMTQVRVPVMVMYNPTEYTVSYEGKIAEGTRNASGQQGTARNVQFTGIEVPDFTVTLFFDTYEKNEDVRKTTKEIADLIMPVEERGEFKIPPICRFVWGKFEYKGVVRKIDQKFTMFLGSGIPVRAELTVTFKSTVNAQEHARRMGKAESRKFWTVTSGDRLDLIAEEKLGDPTLWRVIADANNIQNIIAFPESMIGSVLVIPDYHSLKG